MEKKFIPESIIDYCVKQSTNSSPTTKEIYNLSKNMPNGHMVIGELSGFLLRAIVLMKRPSSILEVGCFIGYSLSILNEYSPEYCKIISLEEDKNNFDISVDFFERNIDYDKVKIINDEGIGFLEKNNIKFDLIFIDARKDVYYNRLDLIYSRLEEFGVLIVDNALAGLGVLNPKKQWEEQTIQFNESLKSDSRFISMIMPIRDGFNIALKIK